jgi:hypothetical protein
MMSLYFCRKQRPAQHRAPNTILTSFLFLQILHLGLGNEFHSPSSIRDEIVAAQFPLHRDGQIRTVRSLALIKLLALHIVDDAGSYAIISRASGVSGVRDDDCTWDLEQSSTQVQPQSSDDYSHSCTCWSPCTAAHLMGRQQQPAAG